jgi:hypothetical protein
LKHFVEQIPEARFRWEVVVDEVDEEVRTVDVLEDFAGRVVIGVKTAPFLQP